VQRVDQTVVAVHCRMARSASQLQPQRRIASMHSCPVGRWQVAMRPCRTRRLDCMEAAVRLRRGPGLRCSLAGGVRPGVGSSDPRMERVMLDDSRTLGEGELIGPDDERYECARRVWNVMVDGFALPERKPAPALVLAAVARCAGMAGAPAVHRRPTRSDHRGRVGARDAGGGGAWGLSTSTSLGLETSVSKPARTKNCSRTRRPAPAHRGRGREVSRAAHRRRWCARRRCFRGGA
jgi:hypothetical protein